MADTATKSETKRKKGEEQKLSLPIGHPQAGYVPPDLSFRDGAGENDEEAEALEEQVKERDKLVAAVEENEHKVATEENEARLKADEEASKKDEKK